MKPIISCLIVLAFTSCNTTATPSLVSSPPQSQLSQELDRTNTSANQSAQNALDQARFSYNSISPRLANIGVDTQAFQELKTKVLPSFIAVANTLTTQDNPQIKSDFKELYSDVVAQVLNGINNNLQLYQGSFELPQSDSFNYPEALKELSLLFEATKLSTEFVSELSQFNQVLDQTEFNQIVQGFQNQQVVIVNGILRFSSQTTDIDELKSAYQTLVRSITSPSLFTQLRQIAEKTFGPDKIAFTQEQLTPSQTNPNQLVMIIQEGENTYRMVRFSNGQLQNEVSQDTRGLSAADLLKQSQVVVIQG